MSKAKPALTPSDLYPQWKALRETILTLDDMPCAIVGAAFMEHCLGALLQKDMAENCESASQLLDPQKAGAISSCNARKHLCFARGLITADIRDEIGHIANIRNKFAHRFLEVRFDDAEVTDVCRKLKANGYINQFQTLDNKTLTPRQTYAYAVLCIASLTLMVANSIEHPKELKYYTGKMKPLGLFK